MRNGRTKDSFLPERASCWAWSGLNQRREPCWGVYVFEKDVTRPQCVAEQIAVLARALAAPGLLLLLTAKLAAT